MNVHTPETRLRFRLALESEVERLISLLDEMEADPDLEDSGDENDTGAPLHWGTSHAFAFGDQRVIIEDDEEGDPGEDDGTEEPTLGAPEKHHGFFTSWSSESHPAVSQAFWSDGGNRIVVDDCEIENEHGGDIQDEPHDDGWNSGSDYEPELGWTGHGKGCGENEPTDDREGDDEREHDVAEYGIGDADALQSEDMMFTEANGFDGSGARLAARMLHGGGGTYRPDPLLMKLPASSRISEIDCRIAEVAPRPNYRQAALL